MKATILNLIGYVNITDAEFHDKDGNLSPIGSHILAKLTRIYSHLVENNIAINDRYSTLVICKDDDKLKEHERLLKLFNAEDDTSQTIIVLFDDQEPVDPIKHLFNINEIIHPEIIYVKTTMYGDEMDVSIIELQREVSSFHVNEPKKKVKIL